jgi:hypothetical protein
MRLGLARKIFAVFTGFQRGAPESGRVVLTLSFVAFDPKQTRGFERPFGLR